MNCELTTAQTSDGLTLHGALFRSSAEPVSSDLIIFVHGVGGNFYQSSLVKKTRTRFSEAGISLLSVNTRGHDFVFAAGHWQGETWLGSANEIVADCRFDLAAWVQKAEKLGFRNIVLLGHSLGAIKTLYAMTHEPPRSTCLKGIVAVSPSCLAASTFLASSRAEEYQRYLGWARQQIEQGAENRITEVTFPLRLMMSARTFLDKYGPEERYNILRFLDQVPLPLKLVFGELEVRGENPAFRDLDRKAAEVVGTDSGSSLTVVTGADHFYSGVQDRLADCILDWTRNLV